MPHERSFFRGADMEEERRLMYVAMTRAKRSLNISFFGRPSRFLNEIPPEFVVFDDYSSFGNSYSDPDEDTIYLD